METCIREQLNMKAHWVPKVEETPEEIVVVVVEQPWRSVTYEEGPKKAYETIREAKEGLGSTFPPGFLQHRAAP